MPFEKVLDLSTAHLSKQDRAALDGTRGEGVPRILGHDFGWIVFVPGDEPLVKALATAGFSKAFCALVKLAQDKGCMLINFDQDADEHDGLETFEW